MRLPEYASVRQKTKCLFLFLLFGLCTADALFLKGKEYQYTYKATSSSGVFIPSKAASTWSFQGNLVVQAQEDSVIMQLQSLRTSISNGPLDAEENQIYSDVNNEAKVLTQPFNVTYNMGLVQNLSVEVEPNWSINIKRSLAGILQLDLNVLHTQVAFQSTEYNHYGQCSIEYVVTTEEHGEKVIRKSVDPRNCVGHPDSVFSNVPPMKCPNNDQNPILKSSDRLYRINVSQNNETTINFINATGGIYLQPFQSLGEMQYLFTRQELNLVSVKNITEKIVMKSVEMKHLQHELPEHDLTQGRGAPDKNTIFKSIGSMLDRLSQRLETPGLDTEIENLHNTTISVLLYYLNMLDKVDLGTAYNNISGTSYKEETVRNMFLETLPQVGSTESALFILDLITQKKVSDMTAIQLLTHLPFHIRKPDVQLLVSLQPLLNLPSKCSAQVQNTAILTYGTLIYKTCLLYCPYEMLDDYVKIYLDKYTESDFYEKKLVWLQGLANIQLGRVVEFLEPVATGANGETRHLRALAAWASLPSAPLRPEVIYPVYWPILVNRSEHLEMRVVSLTLLIISNPSPSRLISLYWYMKSEPSVHLYNFFYTTLKSLERTNYPCYVHVSGLASQFTRMLRKPSSKHRALTGNYIFDYQDTYRHFGAMIHGIVVADELTNMPEVISITLDNHGNGKHLNHLSFYIKAEGLLHSLSTYVEQPTRVEDILKQFKTDQKSTNPVHVEIIARIQDKVVLCLHTNQTNLMQVIKYVASLQDSIYHTYNNMEFHVNEQTIHVPVTMESTQVTDLGTNVRLAMTVTSLYSMRGNFTHVPNGRNNHVILRASVHSIETIESYNPLSDLWHSAERVQSFHVYLPFNLTFGFQERLYFSYNTPGDKLRTGAVAHTRTSTNIRGPLLSLKLKYICAECSSLYIVKENKQNTMKTETLFQLKVPELGGHVNVKLFDCEKIISFSDVTTDVLYSHRSNHQILPAVQVGLLALHVLDYFTYSSTTGSCGLALYFEPDISAPTEVKFDYGKVGKINMFSLRRTNLVSNEILEQWSIALIYEAASWISDTIKLKATRTAPNEKITKICVEVEREIPWEWDFLSVVPSQSSSLKLNFAWDMASDSAKGKCTDSSVSINLIAEVSSEQIDESNKSVWPYDECRLQTKGKTFVPYSDACYEASKELSTLRKYESFIRYENLPEKLAKVVKKLEAAYDLASFDDTTSVSQTDQFLLSATFDKSSSFVDLKFNRKKTALELNPDLVNYVLFRTRLHKYMDNPFFKSFVDTCILTPKFVRSSNNVTDNLVLNEEVLVLGHCYDDKVRFAISAVPSTEGITLILNDESDQIKITPHKKGATVYNYMEPVPMEKNFEFVAINSKRIRMDDTTVDLIFADTLLFMHWTQEYILIFYPSYVREFACGLCTSSTKSETLYRRNIDNINH